MDPASRAATTKSKVLVLVVVLAGSILAMIVFATIAGSAQGWYWLVSGPDRPPPAARTPPADRPTDEQPPSGISGNSDTPEDPRFIRARETMVRRHFRGRDITDRKALQVMGRIPRQRFVPPDLAEQAYADRPLPIGHGQTISQPYIVALMTQLARPKAGSRALDVGTGSGYQAAVLGEICKEVYSIEILKPLADEARTRLKRLGYKNVTVRSGDGYRGWPEKAPFDVIIVAAAPDHVPQPLIDQLAPGGRLVIPVGEYYQELVVIEKKQDGTTRRTPVIPVMFVPMTGEAEKQKGR